MIKPKGYYCTLDGQEHPVLLMDVDEAIERTSLQVANTASSLRNRVLQQLAKSNGHGPIGPT